MTEPKPNKQYEALQDSTMTATAPINLNNGNGKSVTITVSSADARLLSEIQKRRNQAQLQQIERYGMIDFYTGKIGSVLAME